MLPAKHNKTGFIMLLHEIISLSDECKTGILTDEILKYKKSLYTYYKNQYKGEPVFIVTAVFNSCSLGFIAPANEMTEAIETYLNSDDSLTEEDKESEMETINFNSIMLVNL